MDFNRRLSQKQHAGELVFDHAEEKLSLSVSRNSQDAQAKATTDARNLSGGERSFTTLAFELAMWEFCATPFRVLDECGAPAAADALRPPVTALAALRAQSTCTWTTRTGGSPSTLSWSCAPRSRTAIHLHHAAGHAPLSEGRDTLPKITRMADVRPA